MQNQTNNIVYIIIIIIIIIISILLVLFQSEININRMKKVNETAVSRIPSKLCFSVADTTRGAARAANEGKKT